LAKHIFDGLELSRYVNVALWNYLFAFVDSIDQAAVLKRLSLSGLTKNCPNFRHSSLPPHRLKFLSAQFDLSA
jgi:hypothetical protein